MTPLIKYGVVGVGMMGIEHIMNLINMDGVVVTAIADTYPDSIRKCLIAMKEATAALGPEAAAYMDGVKVYHSAEDLFKAGVCDVAVVATPNFTHHEVLMTAFAKAPDDLHILVEKPLCTTIEHCKEVTKAAARRSGIVWVGLEYSYMPPVSRVIADTKRGVIVRVFATGAQAVNHLDEVYEDGKRPDILDNAYVLVDYSNGARAALDLCMFAEASHCQEEVSIVGSKGKLEAFLPQLEVRTGVRGRDQVGHVHIEVVDDDRIKYKGHHHGSSYLEHLDILATVRSFKSGIRQERTAGLEQGTLSVAIGVAAHKSIDEGRPVAMKELLTEHDLRAVERYSSADASTLQNAAVKVL